MKLFESVQTLYNHELYEELIFVHELENNTNGFFQKQEYLYNVYVADAYYHLEQFKLSTRYYSQAIQLYPQVSRAVTTKNLSDADVRYRYHLCLIKENKYEEALGVLSKIPTDSAPPKIHHAIAKILACRENILTKDSQAVKHMKALIENCPVAYSTYDQLIKLGVEMKTEPDKSLNNVFTFIKAHEFLRKDDPHAAIQMLQTDRLGYNRRISLEIGKIFYDIGMKNDARCELAKAHAMDDERPDGMDILAHLYAIETEHHKTLETLGPTIMRNCGNSVEAYIVFGYLSRSLGGARHLSSALHFAYKACNIKLFGGKTHSGAMMLKALILRDMERNAEATAHLKEAIQEDPLNFDLYECLVAFYLQDNNTKDARQTLNSCLLNLSSDPRAQVLKAKLLMKTGTTSGRTEAQRILEPIINAHPYMLDAVWVLMEHYEKTCNYSKGIELLNRLTNSKLPYNSMAILHHLLGEFHTRLDRPDKAYTHFNLAIIRGHMESIHHFGHVNIAMAAQASNEPTQNTSHAYSTARRNTARRAFPSIPFELSSLESPIILSLDEPMQEDPPQ